MVGQTHVVQALGNALGSGRLHHAYLFTGTRGIGKTTVSRILAKSLNCTGPDGTGGVTAQPCGVCQACTEIDADRFIDYIEMDAASNRSIDEIRELIERAAYKPSVGRYKVFMIDEAHQLTKDAFNALLKTLEEPPDYLKFVLATTDPEKMLPTVLSRCLQFNLRPMAPETVAAHLQQVLAAEGVAVDAGALRLLSRAARGSMRDALSLTDQAIAFGAGTLAEDGVRAMLGSVDRSHAAALVAALAVRDGAAVLATLDQLRSLGLSASGTLEEVAALLQQMAVEQAVPGALDDADPDTSVARQLAAALPADETQLLYSIVVHGRAELALLSDEYAALTMVLLRLLAFAPAGGVPTQTSTPRAAPLVAAPREARSSAPARPLPATQARPLATVPLPAVTARLPTAPTAPTALTALTAPTAPVLSSTVMPPAPTPAAPQAVPRQATMAPLRDVSASPAARDARALPAKRVAADSPVASAAAPQRSERAEALPPPWLDDAPPDDFGDGRSISLGVAEPEFEPAAVVARPQPAPPIQALASRPSGLAPLVELQTTALGDQWSALMRPLAASGAVLAMVRELAWQAELTAVSPADGGGRCWQLRVERDSLRNLSLASKLAAALGSALGETAQLEVLAGTAQDSLSRRDALARDTAQREAEQLIEHDPVVRALMAQFSTARIVPGSIKPLAADGGGPAKANTP